MIVLLATAWAQSQSADIELVRPTWSANTLIGADAARLVRAGALRVGLVAQYERDTLLLYRYREEVGAVVANRTTGTLGASWQPLDRLALRAALPVAGQWGSDVPELGGNGFGAGDLSLGARFMALDRRTAAVGGALDLYLPTGAKDLWMGEDSLRAEVSALADLDFGPFGVRGKLGTTLRPPVDTEYDLVVGSEVNFSGAFTYALLPERFRLATGVLTRTGFSGFFQAGETVAEWIGAGEVLLAKDLWLNLGLGRGLSAGYGTSQARLITGVTWTRTPRPPPPEPPRQEVVIEAVPQDLTELEPEPEPVLLLAEVKEDQIVIRDPIQFQFGTDYILPVSQPTLEAIAQILEKNPQILHVVIEGHASEEGSYLYNYNLSLARALAILRALVDTGVHPSRVSARAMGEVVPVKQGSDEASLAANRRVEFHIVRRLQQGEAYPNLGAEVTVPWSGETREVEPPPATTPAPPPGPALPPQEEVPDFTKDLEEEEE